MIGREARAVADVPNGSLLATVWLPASPERVFRALASDEITAWWVRPGVFDTREWEGSVRAGGRWRAAGMGGGRPYSLEGEFVDVEPPTRLVHTWHPAGAAAPPSTVTCQLAPINGGTWLTLRQEGIFARDPLMATTIGWETSFSRLAEILGG